jgi:hypothetical protein
VVASEAQEVRAIGMGRPHWVQDTGCGGESQLTRGRSGTPER